MSNFVAKKYYMQFCTIVIVMNVENREKKCGNNFEMQEFKWLIEAQNTLMTKTFPLRNVAKA